ncbi:MAG: hypothetical protein ACP5OG_02630 [Candidatus Nanoarchaeia archaeon]
MEEKKQKNHYLAGFVLPLAAAAIGATAITFPLIKRVEPKTENSSTQSEIKLPKFKTSGKTTYNIYGMNIFYTDFNKIDFDLIPKEVIKIPKDWKNYFYYNRVRESEKMDSLILGEIKKLGHSLEDIANMNIKESIMLSMDIAASKINYFDVDNDKEFTEKYGKHMAIERYMELEFGDCDKYRDIVSASFNFIKKHNSNLENVYDFKEDFGGNRIAHAWNSFVFLTQDSMILTHIDPTEYDNKGNLEAERGVQIPKNDKMILAGIYNSLHDHEASFSIYKSIFEGSDNYKEKLESLDQMIYLAGGQLKDREKMEFAKQEYLNLNSPVSIKDDLLYYSSRLEESKGNKKDAIKYAEELVRDFPQSYWSKDYSIQELIKGK